MGVVLYCSITYMELLCRREIAWELCFEMYWMPLAYQTVQQPVPSDRLCEHYCLPEEVIINSQVNSWSVLQCAHSFSAVPLSSPHLWDSVSSLLVCHILAFKPTMSEIVLLFIHGALAKLTKGALCLCSDIFLNINKLSCHSWLEEEEERDSLPRWEEHTGWVRFIH